MKRKGEELLWVKQKGFVLQSFNVELVPKTFKPLEWLCISSGVASLILFWVCIRVSKKKKKKKINTTRTV